MELDGDRPPTRVGQHAEGREGTAGNDLGPWRRFHHLVLMRCGQGYRPRPVQPWLRPQHFVSMSTDAPAFCGFLHLAAEGFRHDLMAEADAHQRSLAARGSEEPLEIGDPRQGIVGPAGRSGDDVGRAGVGRAGELPLLHVEDAPVIGVFAQQAAEHGGVVAETVKRSRRRARLENTELQMRGSDVS